MNKLSFDRPYLANKDNSSTDFIGTGVQYTEEELLLLSFLSSEPGAEDPIESAIRKAAVTAVPLVRDRAVQDHNIPGYKVNNFIPFKPTAKHTESTVTFLESGEKFRVIKGAPQVVIKICGGTWILK